MKIKKYDFESNKITASARDGHYFWVAYEDGTLRKVSAFDLNQTFFNLTPEVDSIINLNLDGNNINVLVDDEELIGIRYSTSNPLTTYTNINKPAGVTQTPIKSSHDGSNWFVLLPGTESGTVAELVIFDGTTYDETLKLEKSAEEIINAKDLTVDNSGNVWIVTNTKPAKLIKVFPDGGSWDWESHIIL